MNDPMVVPGLGDAVLPSPELRKLRDVCSHVSPVGKF
jgi:hypothetical protein